MQIYLDMDGVIVDFIGGIQDRFGVDMTNHFNWDFNYTKLFNMNGSEFWNSLDDEWWANLKFTREARELLEFLEPYKPILLSSPTRKNAGGKQTWIAKHLPEWHKEGRYLLGPCKWAVAGQGKILIDDYDEHCDQWFTHGGKSILFPRRWNRLSHIPSKDGIDIVKRAVKYYSKVL